MEGSSGLHPGIRASETRGQRQQRSEAAKRGPAHQLELCYGEALRQFTHGQGHGASHQARKNDRCAPAKLLPNQVVVLQVEPFLEDVQEGAGERRRIAEACRKQGGL